LAEAVAFEWRKQEGEIRPKQMPIMHFSATTIDKVAPRRDEVLESIIDYGSYDLTCYRASEEDLAALQAEHWQPLLDWQAKVYGVRMSVTVGIMSILQPTEALTGLRSQLTCLNDGEVTALYELTTLTGSLVIPLALVKRKIDVNQAWFVATIDERYQTMCCGQDSDEISRLGLLRDDIESAYCYFKLCNRAQ
jgi:chaperone required for assembly of F1-ATPase